MVNLEKLVKGAVVLGTAASIAVGGYLIGLGAGKKKNKTSGLENFRVTTLYGSKAEVEYFSSVHGGEIDSTRIKIDYGSDGGYVSIDFGKIYKLPDACIQRQFQMALNDEDEFKGACIWLRGKHPITLLEGTPDGAKRTVITPKDK